MKRGLSLTTDGAVRTMAVSWLLTSLLIIVSVLDPHAAWASSPLQLHGALQRDAGVGIIAHRGAAALAPENTLAAFRISLSQRVDFVETDVQLTADGVPVLMHDPKLDRTTNGTGALAEHSFDQVRSLDAGGWFSSEFAGEPVPTLEEFVELLAPTVTNAFVELKGPWPADKIGEVVELLREQRLAKRLVLTSFEREALEVVRDIAPEFAVVLLTRDLDAATIDYAIDLQVSAVCARDKLFADHPDSITQFHEAGIGVIAYTLNTKKQWRKAQKLGVDFYVTDDPPALAEWREAQS